jgi:hypothetical protein
MHADDSKIHTSGGNISDIQTIIEEDLTMVLA